MPNKHSFHTQIIVAQAIKIAISRPWGCSLHAFIAWHTVYLIVQQINRYQGLTQGFSNQINQMFYSTRNFLKAKRTNDRMRLSEHLLLPQWISICFIKYFEVVIHAFIIVAHGPQTLT